MASLAQASLYTATPFFLESPAFSFSVISVHDGFKDFVPPSDLRHESAPLHTSECSLCQSLENQEP